MIFMERRGDERGCHAAFTLFATERGDALKSAGKIVRFLCGEYRKIRGFIIDFICAVCYNL